MLETDTKFFGRVEYAEDAIIRFDDGIPGFDSERRFLLLERPSSRPLVFFQSLSRPELCFIALPVLVIDQHYQLMLQPEDLERLDLPVDSQPTIGTDVLCLALVTIRAGAEPTANLLSPVVINIHTRRAAQAIQAESQYDCRHSLQALIGA